MLTIDPDLIVIAVFLSVGGFICAVVMLLVLGVLQAIGEASEKAESADEDGPSAGRKE